MAINVTLAVLHALAFSAYIGGLLFMEVVLGPAQEAIPPAQATVLSRKTGDRQAIIAWSSLAVILITGILRLERANQLEFPGTAFLRPELASTGYGRTIYALFCLWLVLVILGSIMTFYLRPILVGKIEPTLPKAEQTARRDRMAWAARVMSIVMRVDLVVVVAAAVFGASLAFGGLL